MLSSHFGFGEECGGAITTYSQFLIDSLHPSVVRAYVCVCVCLCTYVCMYIVHVHVEDRVTSDVILQKESIFCYCFETGSLAGLEFPK